MSTKALLDRLAQQLRNDSITREEQVKQFIIEPLLADLGWDLHTLGEVEREFKLEGVGRADYALADRGKPLLFIEAKQLGKPLIAGMEQLFRYANNRGIPILVLTDGDVWHFYLSMASGKPEDRLFFSATLSRDNTEVIASSFGDFLRKDEITSERARRRAEQSLEESKSQERARNEIPQVWGRLVRNRDELLRELIQEAVKEKVGSVPAMSDVDKFLDSTLSESTQRLRTRRKPISPQRRTSQVARSSAQSNSRIKGIRLFGKTIPTSSGIDAYRQIIGMLLERDPEFIEQFAQQGRGRKRVWVARSKHSLFPHNPELVNKHSFDLGHGWWSGENLSINEIRRRVKVACEVAGLEFGEDVDFDLVDD